MSLVPVMRRVAECERPILSTHGAGDAARAPVEAFIRTVYARRFGAEIRTESPVARVLVRHGAAVIWVNLLEPREPRRRDWQWQSFLEPRI